MNQVKNIRIILPRQKWICGLTVISILFAYLFSLFQLKLQFFGDADTFTRALTFAKRMLTPDFSNWQEVLYAALESLCVSVFATILSVVLAFFTGFFAATNTSAKGAVLLLKGLVSLIRAVPTLIWVLIFVAFLGLGPFAGVLGLLFHSYAYLVKAFSQSIEEVDEGEIEALKATGASWVQTMAGSVVPSIRTSVISWTALRFEINVGQSSILGLVGAGGIGHELSLAMRNYNFEAAGFVMLVIFLMSFAIEMLFNKLKLNVDNKHR